MVSDRIPSTRTLARIVFEAVDNVNKARRDFDWYVALFAHDWLSVEKKREFASAYENAKHEVIFWDAHHLARVSDVVLRACARFICAQLEEEVPPGGTLSTLQSLLEAEVERAGKTEIPAMLEAMCAAGLIRPRFGDAERSSPPEMGIEFE